jgi:hypothetical protein
LQKIEKEKEKTIRREKDLCKVDLYEVYFLLKKGKVFFKAKKRETLFF